VFVQDPKRPLTKRVRQSKETKKDIACSETASNQDDLDAKE